MIVLQYTPQNGVEFQRAILKENNEEKQTKILIQEQSTLQK